MCSKLCVMSSYSFILSCMSFRAKTSLVDWLVQSVYLSQLERQELYSQSVGRFSVWQVQCLVCLVA